MIVVSDLEGTLTDGATWRAFGSYLKKHRSALAYNLFLARWLPIVPLVQWRLLDQEKVRNRWIKEELALLTDTTPAEFERVAEWIVRRELWARRRLGMLAELAEHRQNGARIVIASGTYQPVAEVFTRHIQAEAIATPVIVEDGRVHVTGKHCTGKEKSRRVRELLGDTAVDVAYGDTLADLPLLEMSVQPVAAYPDKHLRRVAEQRGWRIIDEQH